MFLFLYYPSGKLVGQSVEAATVPGRILSRLYYVTDRTTGVKFLVDTGAELSVIPRGTFQRDSLTGPTILQAANGSRIATYGQQSLTLDLGLRRSFPWIFTIADVKIPILGADFLAHFSLTIDMKKRHLLDTLTSLSVTSIQAHAASYPIRIRVACKSKSPVFDDLLRQYPQLLQPSQKPLTTLHTVQHHITTTGQPTFARPRQLLPDKLRVIKAEFEHMLQLGIVRPSDSCWASPLHMVVKKTAGDWCPCGDYRAINCRTVTERYSLPHIHDFALEPQGTPVFRKLTLCAHTVVN